MEVDETPLPKDEQRYRLYDQAGWRGPSSWGYIAVALLSAAAAWYLAVTQRWAWPAQVFLIFIPTWTLCGGYVDWQAAKARFFVASAIALVPGLIARTVFTSNIFAWNLAALGGIVVVALVIAVAHSFEPGSRRLSLPVLRVLGFILVTLGLVAALLGYINWQVAGLLFLAYVFPLLVDSTHHIFRRGWAETVYEDEDPPDGTLDSLLYQIVRVGRMLRNAVIHLVHGVVDDYLKILRFLLRWVDAYGGLILAFAVAKILYDAMLAICEVYVVSGGFVLVFIMGAVNAAALYCHVVAGALLVYAPWVSSEDEPTRGALPRVAAHRIDDTLGVWATGICCLLPLPGLTVSIVTQQLSVLWILSLGAIGLIAALVGVFGRQRVLEFLRIKRKEALEIRTGANV